MAAWPDAPTDAPTDAWPDAWPDVLGVLENPAGGVKPGPPPPGWTIRGPFRCVAIMEQPWDNARMGQLEQLSTRIPGEYAGWRLDKALACIFSQYSRACIQRWIRKGEVRLDQGTASPRLRLQGGEQIQVNASFEEPLPWLAQDIPLRIAYEDEALLIIDKPANLVVHPGAGNPTHTLLNALLHYAPQLGIVPRAGIVHRLDKDTSGLMVVAKSPDSHSFLVDQLKERAIGREYQALVNGIVPGTEGSIDLCIGRHPGNRKKMAVREGGKPALTHYRVLRRFHAQTLLHIKLETGRTHQIRVHMAERGHAVLGDALYGSASPDIFAGKIDRQMLHACRLELSHPGHRGRMCWSSALPQDMQAALESLAG